MAAMRMDRLIAIHLDSQTISWRSPHIEQERKIAVFDLLEDNQFFPTRAVANGYNGPYRLTLRVVEGRLVFDIADADEAKLESIILGLARFRGLVRHYFAICDSYYSALQNATPQQIETIDMARRSVHDEAATLLMERLAGKIEVDFATARRLFTLVCVLHVKG